jgi:Spy/CpxP family protein refolding chaperone
MRTVVRVAIVIASAALAAPLGIARAESPTSQAPHGTQPASSEVGDIAQLVDEAFAGIQLRADQKDALQKIGADVDASVAVVEEARRELLAALADQLDTANVDSNAIQPKMQRVIDRAADASPVVRGSFEKIHAILDPAQRKQFVAALRSSLAAHATAGDVASQVEQWSKTLALTDTQKATITTMLSAHAEANEVARDRLELVLAAFPGDTFVMDDLLPATATRTFALQSVLRIVDTAHEVSTVLTPQQRAIAAKAIRDKIAGRASALKREEVSSTAQALWAGYGTMGAYHASSGFGFGTGYAAGYGGTFFF